MSDNEGMPGLDLSATGYDRNTRLWEIIILYQGIKKDILTALDSFPGVTINFLLCNFAILNTPRRHIDELSKLPFILYMEQPTALHFQMKAAMAALCLPAYGTLSATIRDNINDSINQTRNINDSANQTRNINDSANQTRNTDTDNTATPTEKEYIKLTGNGVIVGIIDTGIDFASRQFCDDDKKSRILYAWDQTVISGTNNTSQIHATAPNATRHPAHNHSNAPYGFGQEYDNTDLTEAISAGSAQTLLTDTSGHGTAVAQIAAGGNGVAGDCKIIFVKLGLSGTESFPRTTRLMYAIDYIIRKAIEAGLPVTINISYGNNYGDHQGGSLLEHYINAVSAIWKINICVGTGNEGVENIHYSASLNTTPTQCRFAIAPFERSLSLQIWNYCWDYINFILYAPDGTAIPLASLRTDSPGHSPAKNLGDNSDYGSANNPGGNSNVNLAVASHVSNNSGVSPVVASHAGTKILSCRKYASPLSIMCGTFIEFMPCTNAIHYDTIPKSTQSNTPLSEYIENGIWKLEIIPISIRYGRIDAWLSDSAILNDKTGFLEPDPERTFTIPSTCTGCISVGAYDAATMRLAPFSGRGYTLTASGFGECKPEICAPGVKVSVGGQTVTGTSFATPFVTGVCALMMEWGIALGYDPFLYGERLKALLISNTKKPPSFGQLPNSQAGYGALCAPQPDDTFQ